MVRGSWSGLKYKPFGPFKPFKLTVLNGLIARVFRKYPHGGKKNWHPSLKLSDSTKGSQKHVYLRLRQHGSTPEINPAGREVQAQLHSELNRLGVLLLCCYRLPGGGVGLGKLLGASTWVSARPLL